MNAIIYNIIDITTTYAHILKIGQNRYVFQIIV
jgi:hypothetical protein